MSRILRRPMFRGGRVDSRGTGITSGLADGGRVGFQNGGKSGLDFLKQAFLGPRFTNPNFQPPKLFPKGVGIDFGQSPRDFSKALQPGSAYSEYLKPEKEEFETEVTESGDIKFKLDKDGNRIPIDTTDLSLKETIEKKKIEDIPAD